MPHPSASQRDEVRGDEGGDAGQAATADSRDHAAGDDGPGVRCEAADQGSDGEENVAEDQTVAAAEEVRQFARQRLAGRIGDQITGGEPGEEGQRVETAADWSGEGGHYRQVCGMVGIIFHEETNRTDVAGQE